MLPWRLQSGQLPVLSVLNNKRLQSLFSTIVINVEHVCCSKSSQQWVTSISLITGYIYSYIPMIIKALLYTETRRAVCPVHSQLCIKAYLQPHSSHWHGHDRRFLDLMDLCRILECGQTLRNDCWPYKSIKQALSALWKLSKSSRDVKFFVFTWRETSPPNPFILITFNRETFLKSVQRRCPSS